jgi:uncharacterized protein (TIGR02145 family)
MMELLFMQPLSQIFSMKKYVLLACSHFFLNTIIFAQVVPQGFLVNPPDQTVTIGSQVWMKYNLDVTTYQNGDAIEGADIDFNRTNTTPAWCYYNHNSNFNATYGKLYNGYAIKDARNICPVGFRVPSQADFNTLASTIGGTANGYKLKEVGTTHWLTPNTGATNSTNFTALPAGYMGDANSSSFMTTWTYFWSTTPIPNNSTNYVRILQHNNTNFTESTAFSLAGGASVRCIKN